MMGRVVRAVAVAVQVAKSSFSVSVESVNRIVLYPVPGSLRQSDRDSEMCTVQYMYTTRVRKLVHVVRVALLTYFVCYKINHYSTRAGVVHIYSCHVCMYVYVCMYHVYPSVDTQLTLTPVLFTLHTPTHLFYLPWYYFYLLLLLTTLFEHLVSSIPLALV
jgi:hypothetical protein